MFRSARWLSTVGWFLESWAQDSWKKEVGGLWDGYGMRRALSLMEGSVVVSLIVVSCLAHRPVREIQPECDLSLSLSQKMWNWQYYLSKSFLLKHLCNLRAWWICLALWEHWMWRPGGAGQVHPSYHTGGLAYMTLTFKSHADILRKRKAENFYNNTSIYSDLIICQAQSDVFSVN